MLGSPVSWIGYQGTSVVKSVRNQIGSVKIQDILIVKLREREGQRVDLGRSLKSSFIDGGWWMVDILSLMLYIKFGYVTFPPPPPPPPPNVS